MCMCSLVSYARPFAARKQRVDATRQQIHQGVKA